MKNLITEHWNNNDWQLPHGNLIVYPNGHITMLSCYEVYDPNTEECSLFCRPLCDTTIDSILKYNPDSWVSIDPWATIDYKGGKIHCGDGAMGNEGFIACSDEAGNLLWAMFFDNTNPFKSLEIKGNCLLAINEHSELQLEINLDNLRDIKMKILVEDRHFYRKRICT